MTLGACQGSIWTILRWAKPRHASPNWHVYRKDRTEHNWN